MVFVTGGTGLVGSHLLFELVSNHVSVRALCRTESSLEEVKSIFSFYSEQGAELFAKIEWMKGDILDLFSLYEGLEGVSQVYHCAAMVSINTSDGERMIYNNVTGTANVMNAALEKNIQKLCYVSSVATLGSDKNKEITETTSWNEESNISAYAISKYLSENEVWRASAEGLNVVVVNPSIIIGPCNSKRSSGLFFKTAYNGLSWYSGGGMGYVDVRDVVGVMINLMSSEISKQKFILNAENKTFKEFLDLVHIALGKPVPNKKAGKFLLQLAWRLDKLKSHVWGSEQIFTKEVASYAANLLAYSNEKIKNELKINFIPTEIAVKNAAKYFLLSRTKRGLN